MLRLPAAATLSRLPALLRRASSPACRRASSSAASAAAAPEAPTMRQLLLHARLAAVPMVGFGFMDNIIMVTAGDMIDQHLGATLGITTLTAAALGNVCSDSSGVLFGGVVDAAAERLKLTRPHFTPTQLAARSVRLAGTLGSLVGVICGCFLGMTTLVFKDLDAAEKLRRSQQVETE